MESFYTKPHTIGFQIGYLRSTIRKLRIIFKMTVKDVSGTNPENRPIERFRSVCSGNTIGM